jgi:hypothetical protein
MESDLAKKRSEPLPEERDQQNVQDELQKAISEKIEENKTLKAQLKEVHAIWMNKLDHL